MRLIHRRLAVGAAVCTTAFTQASVAADLPAAAGHPTVLLIGAQRAATRGLQSSDYQLDLLFAHLKQGDLHLMQGELDEAQAKYAGALAAAGRLLQRQPDNIEWQRCLAAAQLAVGDERTARRDWGAAIEAYRAGLKVAAAQLAATPSLQRWSNELTAAMAHEADDAARKPDPSRWAMDAVPLLLVAGDLVIARNDHENEMRGFTAYAGSSKAGYRGERLVDSQLPEADPRHDAAVLMLRLGAALAAQGRLDAAVEPVALVAQWSSTAMQESKPARHWAQVALATLSLLPGLLPPGDDAQAPELDGYALGLAKTFKAKASPRPDIDIALAAATVNTGLQSGKVRPEALRQARAILAGIGDAPKLLRPLIEQDLTRLDQMLAR